MATSNTNMGQVRHKVIPYTGSLETVSVAVELLVNYCKEINYVNEMYELKNKFEATFAPKKDMYKKIGSEMKNAIITCNVPSELGKDIYYSVRTIDMENGESHIKENYVTNGIVPYVVYELSLEALKLMVSDDEPESRKNIKNYIEQLKSMRLFEKIRERYVKDKDMVFSIMVNPIMMTKLEVMLIQERNLEDVPGCRVQFHPGNKYYYKDGEDDHWKKQWLSSVENLVVESYIKPHTCEEEIFHQVMVSGFHSVATADKISGSDKKRSNVEMSPDSEEHSAPKKSKIATEQVKSKKDKIASGKTKTN